MLASRPAHSAWSTSRCGEADSRRSGEPPLERPEHPDGFSGPPGVLDSGPAPGGAGTSAGGTAQDVDGGGETDHVLDDRAPYGHGRQVVGGGAKRSPWNTVKLALRPGAIAPSSTPAVCAAESVYAVRASARVSRCDGTTAPMSTAPTRRRISAIAMISRGSKGPMGQSEPMATMVPASRRSSSATVRASRM